MAPPVEVGGVAPPTTTTTLLNPHSSHKVTSGPGKPGAGENDKEEESVRPGAIGAPSLVAVWIVVPSGKMNWQGRRREGKGKKEKGRKD